MAYEVDASVDVGMHAHITNMTVDARFACVCLSPGHGVYLHTDCIHSPDPCVGVEKISSSVSLVIQHLKYTEHFKIRKGICRRCINW